MTRRNPYLFFTCFRRKNAAWVWMVFFGLLFDLPIAALTVRIPDLNDPAFVEDANVRLQEAIRNNDTLSLANGLLDLGGYYLKQGNIPQAIEYYADAAGLFGNLDDNTGKTSAYIGLGYAYTDLGEYRKGLRNFREAEALCSGLRDSCLLTHILLGEADLFQQMDKIDQAMPLYLQARNIARNNHYRELLVKALAGLSSIENKKGDYLSSLVHYKESKNLTDSASESITAGGTQEKSMMHSSADESRLMNLEKEYQAQKYRIARHRLWLFGMAGTIFLLLLSALLFFYFLRLRNRRKMARLTLQNLRQQMNPHFLFNVMNSVYLHMLEDNKSESIEYLSKLTRVLRKTLENSREDLIHLSEEIELIELYLELEQKRLQKISWEILVDASLNPKKLYVPSLLIQPYVENSVVHGLANLDAPGKIMVHFRKNGGTIHCEITDNGIGRNLAEQKRRKDHHSLGSSITATRLNLLNSVYGKPVKAMYSDVFDDHDRVAGTRVVLDIPYEDHITESA